MQFTEIYADDAGETHLRDIRVNLGLRDFAPPSAPMGVSPETPRSFETIEPKTPQQIQLELPANIQY
jgi:hypothetical protein